MDKTEYARTARVFPDVYNHAVKSLLIRLPLFRMECFMQILKERAEMIAFRSVSICYVNNLEEFENVSRKEKTFTLHRIVQSKVDYAFVDNEVMKHIAVLLPSRLRSSFK